MGRVVVTEEMYNAGLRYLNGRGTAWSVVDLYRAMAEAAPKSDHSEPKGVTVPFALWDNIEDFIQGQVDVRDGSDGPRPNRAMQLMTSIEQEVK